MSLSKKIIITTIIMLLLIGFLILFIFLYNKSKYSLENVINMLTAPKEALNIHVTTNYNNAEEHTITDTFFKNNIYYSVTKTTSSTEPIQEFFYNSEDSNLISVNSKDKTITTISNISSNNLPFFTTSKFFLESSKNSKFKYLGKEKIDNQKCIKVCLNYNSVSKTYYYINLKNNCIIKEESFNLNDSEEWEKISDVTYTYSYNSVTDNDIIRFDSTNYPNYTSSQTSYTEE